MEDPGTLTAQSYSSMKKIDPNEGPLLGVQHFNSESASVLLYTTQGGMIRAWDLRTASEPFALSIRPELGSPTQVALAPDRNWVVAGTTRGYIALWDLRFNTMAKLWRHSSHGNIRRIACCKPIPGPGKREDIMQHTDGAYMFVAAGNNEAAVWGIPEGGECFKCFRSLSMAQAYDKIDDLPFLEDIPLPPHPNGIITSTFFISSQPFYFNPRCCANSPRQLSTRRSLVCDRLETCFRYRSLCEGDHGSDLPHRHVVPLHCRYLINLRIRVY